MTSNLISFEKIIREIIEKQDHVLEAPSVYGCCDMCIQHKRLLARSAYQSSSLLRGVIAYLEKIKQDRREKRRRHKQNVNMRKEGY